MSPAPPSNDFADHAYGLLEPVADTAGGDEARGWPLLAFVVGISQMWQPVEAIVRSTDGKPAWSQALDVDRCPTFLLPWLGQFVGVRVRSGSDDADARGQIRDEQGFDRGTVPALIAAVQATLDPASTRFVFVEERLGGDAGQIRVTVRTAQVLDASATLAAATVAKRWGLILTLLSTAAATYGELEADFAGNTYANAETSFATYADAEAT